MWRGWASTDKKNITTPHHHGGKGVRAKILECPCWDIFVRSLPRDMRHSVLNPTSVFPLRGAPWKWERVTLSVESFALIMLFKASRTSSIELALI